jgi:acyl carrier protein
MGMLEEMKVKIKAIVSEILEVPQDKLSDEARFFEDLNVDSMMALEIVASIEKKLKIVIPEEEIPKLRSLKEVYESLDKLMAK